MEKVNFEKHMEKEIEKVIEANQHNPQFQSTKIIKKIFDEKLSIGAFVVFEQIDVSGCTPKVEGFRGNQFRYSVWFVTEIQTKQIYEDYDYVKKTGNTSGRDATIGLEKVIKDGVIATITPKGVVEAGYGDLVQSRIKITSEGKIEEPEEFLEQAQNLIKKVGEKLGYDYMTGSTKLKGEDIAVLIWATENGSTYGYETVYLVWKNKDGKLKHKTITSNSNYLTIKSFAIENNYVFIDIKNAGEYRVEREELI